jgi:hypothetical protein
MERTSGSIDRQEAGMSIQKTLWIALALAVLSAAGCSAAGGPRLIAAAPQPTPIAQYP